MTGPSAAQFRALKYGKGDNAHAPPVAQRSTRTLSIIVQSGCLIALELGNKYGRVSRWIVEGMNKTWHVRRDRAYRITLCLFWVGEIVHCLSSWPRGRRSDKKADNMITIRLD